MTKNANGKGYHCDKCGEETDYLGCQKCYPKETRCDDCNDVIEKEPNTIKFSCEGWEEEKEVCDSCNARYEGKTK